MLEHTQLEVSPRTERGKNAARRLRVTGQTPATVYGLGQDPLAVALDTKAMVGYLNDRSGRNRVFELTGGTTGSTMAVAWQSDPVTSKLLHVDLRRVDMTTPVTVKVPLHMSGEAYGVKTEGGIIDVILREIDITCLPDNVPETFEVDITEMRAGSSVRVSDLADSEIYKISSNPNMTVLRLVGKRTDINEDGSGEGTETEEVVEEAAAEGEEQES